ncbi:hypothetical protein ACFYLX_00860 [Pseudarthrobacter enclensis]|uniref:hypothetical protein n=1 Tax=Pseudarthrobacter enclensis TaxID=993070 RepID=UPI0036A46C0C
MPRNRWLPRALPATWAGVFRRAGLAAAVLAIMAGILGMHVLTAGHSGHAGHGGHAVAGEPVAMQATSGSAHAGHAHAGHAAGQPAGHAAVVLSTAEMPGMTGTSGGSDTCAPSCPDAREAGPSCTPLAAAGSLAALPPAALPGARPETPAVSRGDAGYAYIVPSPSPCELSISRT